MNHDTSGRPNRADRPSLGHRFLVVWGGQTLSLIGSTLSGIGIGIWVFLETGSVAALGVLVALANAPSVLMAPFVRLVDRIPRRTVMVGADVVASLGTVVALALAAAGRLEIWHLAVAGFIGGVGSAFQGPAFQASVPMLVDAGALDRANGLNQFGPALGIVIGPVLGAPIVAWWGIEAVLLVDVVTFVIAVVATLSVRFGDARDAVPVADRPDDGSWRAALGWLRTEGRPLVTLIAAMASVNFVLAAYNVSLVALSVEVGGAARSGLVLAAGGVAMIAGSIVLGARGLPRRRVWTFAVVLSAVAIGSLIAASRPWLPVLILGTAVALVWLPAVGASSSTIFHERVPLGMQGRVFGLRFAVGQSLGPIGSLVAGFVIAEAAAPAMRDGSWGGRTVGRVIGSGVERGPALLLLGVAAALVALSVAIGRSKLRAELDGPADSTEADVVDRLVSSDDVVASPVAASAS